jgi:parallel beta-helix repeat protein
MTGSGKMTIQIKRGQSVNMPTLYDGQPAFAEDTEELWIGTPGGNVNVTKGRAITELVDEFNNLLAPTTLYDMENQSLDLNTLKMGYVDAKLNQLYMNVKSNNAKGDGVTDDTVAFQSSFNLAKDNGYVKLYIPEGTYLISSYIRLYKNTFVEMHPNAVIKRIGSTVKVFMNGENGNATYVSGGYNGEGNIHFKGGTIDLNNTTLGTDKTLSAFDLGHAEDLSFTELTIKNGQIGHYYQISSCKNVRFKDCWFGAVSYTDTSSTLYELIQVEVATSTSFPSFGAYDFTISRDIFFERCTFDGVIRALGNHSDGLYGTANTIFCENVQVRNCIFKNSSDNMVNLTAFKGLVFEDNLIINATGYGIYTLKVEDSQFKGNTVLNVQKTGLWLDTSHNNKVSKNYFKETALSTISSYGALRVNASNYNTFDDNTVTSGVVNYTYAWYSSGGSVGNKIISHNFTKGKTATIGGADSTEMSNYQIGAGQDVLYDGDLSAALAVGTLLHDIRNYNFLVIMGNDNSSTTAQLISSVLPKSALMIGTTSRFRLICDDSNATDRVDFSFPTGTSIQVDAVNGTCHIRKVIGIV